MTNRPSVAPADIKGNNRGNPALTEWICGFRFPAGAGPSHTKNGCGPCLHGIHEVRTTKHN